MTRSDPSLPIRLLPRLALAALVLPGLAPAVGSAQGPGPFDASHAREVDNARGEPMGRVALVSTCGEEGGSELRRGLALLHNMTYGESERAFRQAAERSPDCGLAYWGLAMTYLHPLWPDVPTDEELDRGWDLLQEARARGLGSEREQAYVGALEAYYHDGAARSEKERLADYADAWAEVSARYPDDPEAALFRALSMIATAPASDPSFQRQIEAGAIAERVLEAIPDHPGAHHYIIHAFDVPALAERALPVAHSYGEVAPENSHALHMTSHIFTRRGLWEESIDFNRRAADVAREASEDRVSFDHLHAVDYLVYAHLQRGADGEAEAIAANLRGLDGPIQDHTATAYTLAAVPARMALERARWEDAAALSPRQPESLDWDRYPHLVAITEFARALGAAHTGDLAAARQSVDRLRQLEKEAGALPGAYDWGTQVEIQRVAAEAWIAHADGRTDEAISLMTRAADLEATTQKNPVTPGEVLPAGELLGDLLMDVGRYGQALDAYEQALERSRNRFNSLRGAGLAAEKLGDRPTAERYYRQLLEVAGASETRRPELDRIEAYVAGSSKQR